LGRRRGTCTTFVRSRQSIQLTRKAPFCSDMITLFDIQRKLWKGLTIVLFSQIPGILTQRTTYPWLSKVRCMVSINFAIFSYLSHDQRMMVSSSQSGLVNALHAFRLPVEIILGVPTFAINNRKDSPKKKKEEAKRTHEISLFPNSLT